MKIATWNVNSLRVRLPQVLDWLQRQRPDVLALQEIKLQDNDFPQMDIQAQDYYSAFAGQKTYNGVAILSRQPSQDVLADVPGWEDPQRRILAATVDGVRLLNLYVPNGSEVGSDKFAYKLDWLHRMQMYIQQQLAAHEQLVVLGDFNIAPQDRDVHDPEQWRERILCSTPEREALNALLQLGLSDVFRLFDQPENCFSWWDYRAAAFRRNMGLRIDLILASKNLSKRCRECVVDTQPRRLQRPSDHAPVVAVFDI